MGRVLIVDDNDTMRDGVAAVVRAMGHQVDTAQSGDEGIVAFATTAADVVLTDLRMDAGDGFSVLARARAIDDDVIVIVMTGFGTVKAAVELTHAGAFDVLEKPLAPEVLRARVTAGLATRAARRRVAPARDRNVGDGDVVVDTTVVADAGREPGRAVPGRVRGIVGESAAIQKVFRAIEKVAPTDTTVFIHGESGTGKELVARALHDLSPRRDKPFVGINCAAIPATLLESELFGHEQGAFTGAVKRKFGHFELAQGGTLFLDEIGDVSLDMQARLLRALQEKTIERIGGERPIAVDVRIVSATHRDIEKMVADGVFREDLLYRLHIIPLDLPPLRERPDDIPLLVQHFLHKLGPRTRSRVRSVDAACLAVLKNYRWPGNVRELENVLEQALVFADGETLQVDQLPPMLGTLKPPASAFEFLPPADDPRSLDEILEGLEKALILRAYEASGGVKAETARRLGIKTSALYYKLEKYRIGP